jgi:hypothetical protein
MRFEIAREQFLNVGFQSPKLHIKVLDGLRNIILLFSGAWPGLAANKLLRELARDRLHQAR